MSKNNKRLEVLVDLNKYENKILKEEASYMHISRQDIIKRLILGIHFPRLVLSNNKQYKNIRSGQEKLLKSINQISSNLSKTTLGILSYLNENTMPSNEQKNMNIRKQYISNAHILKSQLNKISKQVISNTKSFNRLFGLSTRYYHKKAKGYDEINTLKSLENNIHKY